MKKKLIAVLISFSMLLYLLPADLTLAADGTDTESVQSVVFASLPVTLYSSMDLTESLNYTGKQGKAMPNPLTVVSSEYDQQGGLWYCLDTTGWWNTAAGYPYVSADDVIAVPADGRAVTAQLTDKEGQTVAAAVSGDFSDKATLSIVPITLEETLLDTDEWMVCDNYAAYNITIQEKGHTEWQPAEGETAVILLPASVLGLADGDGFVYYHLADDGTVLASDFVKVRDGMMSIETDGFSDFVVTGQTCYINAKSYYESNFITNNGNSAIPCGFFDDAGIFHILVKGVKGSGVSGKYNGIPATLTLGGNSFTSTGGKELEYTKAEIRLGGGITKTIEGIGLVDFQFSGVTVTLSGSQGNILVEVNGGWTITGPITFTSDYSISKAVNKTNVSGGDTVIYTITVTNSSTSAFPLSDTVITDTIPAGLFADGTVQYSLDNTEWTALPSSGVIASGVSIAIGETKTYYVKGQVSPSAVGTFTNTASISGASLITKTASAGVTASIVNADYTVKHYLQNLDGTTYTLDGPDDIKTGTIGGQTEAVARSYPGFTAQTFAQQEILADGTTVVEIYYNRNLYPYTVKYLEFGTGNVLHEQKTGQNTMFGEIVDEYAVEIPGYTLDSADPLSLVITETVSANEIVFYYSEALGELTIEKSGCDSRDTNQSFIFHVTSTSLVNTSRAAVDMYVTVQGNGSVTIKELPIGTYQVEEVSSWSWRYTPDSAKTVTLTKDSNEETTVNNTRSNGQWFSGSAYAINTESGRK